MSKITIGLLGHSFCCMNLGLGALAISECKIIDTICKEHNIDYEIVCFEFNINMPYTECVKGYNVSLQTFSIKKPVDAIRKFRECDLFIEVTGGDSFADIYGIKNCMASLLPIMYALLAGKSVVMAPQTIGPFSRKSTNIVAQKLLKRCKKVFLRDQISEAAITSKKVNVSKICDMAFILPYEQAERKSNVVGFNISGLLYSKSFVQGFENESSSKYAKLCDEIIGLLKKRGYQVTLVPHVVGGADEDSADNDTYICHKLAEKWDVSVAPSFENPIQAKSYISGFDFFIGSRMHATIASVSTGVPTVPLAYSRKFKGVFEAVGYNETVDLSENTNEQILGKIESALERKEQIQDECKASITKSRNLLSQYSDELYAILNAAGSEGK